MTTGAPASAASPHFHRPIFVVAPAGSGAERVFETLATSPAVRPVDDAAAAFAAVPAFQPANRGWDSERLTQQDAQPGPLRLLVAHLVQRMRETSGAAESDPRPLVYAASNALRVAFLAHAFPGAQFVFVQRDAEDAVAEAAAAWASGEAVTYPEVPGWDGRWSLPLTPEWRRLAGADAATVAAQQWRMSLQVLLDDLAAVSAERWVAVSYRTLAASPHEELQRVCDFLGIAPPDAAAQELVRAGHARSPIPEEVLTDLAEVDRRAREAAERSAPPAPALDPRAAQTARFRSTASASFGPLLEQLGASLLVTTYQTGRLVVVRSAEGRLNTHFRVFDNPMGLAHRGGQVTIGTRTQVIDYRNVPALVPRLQPPGRHDACFVPRAAHFTGDIRVHDVAWAQGQLWMVATRFSCLATLSPDYSFVPRWKPPFITELAAEDRCHLNGLAVVDDEVRYVTALGVSDEAGGWREHKADGGVIIDVTTGDFVVRGLSMPHSPRWYRDQLWVLESGEGGLCKVDLATGRVETIARLPGFTRGLAFAGSLAFVGLSEVREATTFGGLPLTARLENRQCGVWVVDIETGKTVAHLQFEDIVQEIFDVALLPGLRFPEFAEGGSDAVANSFVIAPLA